MCIYVAFIFNQIDLTCVIFLSVNSRMLQCKESKGAMQCLQNIKQRRAQFRVGFPEEFQPLVIFFPWHDCTLLYGSCTTKKENGSLDIWNRMNFKL